MAVGSATQWRQAADSRFQPPLSSFAPQLTPRISGPPIVGRRVRHARLPLAHPCSRPPVRRGALRFVYTLTGPCNSYVPLWFRHGGTYLERRLAYYYMIRTILRTAALAGVMAAPLLLLHTMALAAPATLTLSDQGVNVSAGALAISPLTGRICATVPARRCHWSHAPRKTRKPRLSHSTTTQLSMSWWTTSARPSRVDYAKHAPTAKVIMLDAVVPFSLREGGKATFDGQTVPFPLDLKPGPDGHAIWRGEAARFEITTALGQILAIAAPRTGNNCRTIASGTTTRPFSGVIIHDMARDPRKRAFADNLKMWPAVFPRLRCPSKSWTNSASRSWLIFPIKSRARTNSRPMSR